MKTVIRMVALSVVASACTIPEPYRAPTPPQPVPSSPGSGPAVSQPEPTPAVVPEPQPAPAPVREPTLSPASRALVAQAQAQIAAKNIPLAAASIERALRIEPDNALLWIELAKVRQAEGNHVQTENLARKAVSMSINAPRTQSAAWQLIADSYRARGKNVEARDAQGRADALKR